MKAKTMNRHLVDYIQRYRAQRIGDDVPDLGGYEELEQRLRQADELIELLARELVLRGMQREAVHGAD